MRVNHFLPYGIVATAALTVGGVCGYGFSPNRREANPVVAVPTSSTTVIAASSASSAGSQPVQGAPSIGVLCPETARKPVITTFGAEKTSLPLSAESRVNSREAFRLKVPGGWPVVVVRTVEESVWYVQDECERVEGTLFTASAVFGNSQTPAGTKFELAGIVATSAEEARQYTPGTVLHELPSNLQMTAVVTVVRN